MKHYISVILLLFIFQQITSAQTGTIIGSIYDKNSGQALADVDVMLFPLGVSAATEADGSFTLVKIPEGKYEMVVEHQGYVELRRKILMHPGKTTRSDVYLVPKVNRADMRANDTAIMKQVMFAILAYFRCEFYHKELY